jgi:two-component system cell cycle response regulator
MSNSYSQHWDAPNPRPAFRADDDGTLRPPLLPQDEELSQILDEMNEISKIADSETPDAKVLSQTLRRAVSCVARQSLLEQELRSLALFDDLTGLHNRRAFWTLAAQELRVADRNDQSLLLFFADIDCLKQINDAHGHQEGDLAIIRTAHALQRTFRNSDIVARLGGDEFAVIALEASSQRDEDGILRRLAAHLRALHPDQSRYDLTLSIGSARYDPRNPVPLSQLMEQADRSMYKDKRERSHPSLWSTPLSLK